MSSLLDTPTLSPVQQAQARKSVVQQSVSYLRNTPRQAFDQLLRTWTKGVEAVWNDPAPAEILAGLGTDASELFKISAETAAFLETLKPGCTAATIALIKPTKIDPSGVVTLA